MWVTPRCASGVDDGVLHGRRGGDGPVLADAAGAEFVAIGRNAEPSSVDGRQFRRCRNEIVGQGRGAGRAVGVPLARLHQRLGDARHRAAVLLALGRGFVQHPTAVIHGRERQQRDVAGLDIDFGHCSVDAVRVGGATAPLVDRCLDAAGGRLGDVGPTGQPGRHAGHVRTVGCDRDVIGTGFEQSPRHLADAGAQFGCSPGDLAAEHRSGP